MKKFSKEMNNMSSSLTKLSAPVIAWGTSAVISFNKVQKAMNNLVVGTGATGSALKKLQNDFKTVASGSSSSLEDVSTSVADLNTRLGLSGKGLQALSSQFLNASRMTNENLKSMITEVSSAFKSNGVLVTEYASSLDKLFTASQNSGATITELATNLNRYSGILQTLGLDLDQSISLLMQFEQAGIKSETAMSGLKQAISKMSKSGVSDISNEMKKLFTSIKNAGTQEKALSVASEVLGKSSVELVKGIRDGTVTFGEYSKAVSNSQGAIQDASDRTETFTDRLNKSLNKVQLSSSTLGSAITDIADGALTKFSSTITELNPETAKLWANIGVTATAMIPLTKVIAVASSGFSSLFNVLKNVAHQMALTGSALKGLMSILGSAGGLATIITMVAGYFAYDYVSSLTAAKTETDALIESTDKLRRTINLLSKEQVAGKLADVTLKQQENDKALQEDLRRMPNSGTTSDQIAILYGYENYVSDTSQNVINLKKDIEDRKKMAEQYRQQISLLTGRQTLDTLSEKLSDVASGFYKHNNKSTALTALNAIHEEISKLADEDIKTILLNKYEQIEENISKFSSNNFVGNVGKTSETSSKSFHDILSKFKEIASLQDRLYSLNLTSEDDYKKQLVERKTKLDELNKKYKNNNDITNEQLDLLELINKMNVEALQKQMNEVDKIRSEQDFKYSVGMLKDKEYNNIKLKRYLEDKQFLKNNPTSEEALTRFRSSAHDVFSMQGDQANEILQNNTNRAGLLNWKKIKAAASEALQSIKEKGIPANEELLKLADGTMEAEMKMDDLNQAAADAMMTLADGIADAIVEGKDLGDVLGSIGKQLIKMALMGFGSTQGLLTGLIGGLFGHHTGGIVGYDAPTLVRRLPKFHSGGIVGANEEAAILQKGEGVFTKEQMKRLQIAGAGSKNVEIHMEINNNGSGNMTNEQANTLGKQIKGLVQAQVADQLYEYNRKGLLRT